MRTNEELPEISIQPSKNIFRKVLGFVQGLTVEPLMFFFMFGGVSRVVTFQQMLISHACTNELGIPQELCSNMTKDDNNTVLVQQTANNYNIAYTVCFVLPSVLVAAFLISWSDKYGRRYPLIISLMGLIIESILVVVYSTFPRAELFILVLCALPAGAFGGMIMVTSTIYSYISDLYDESERTMHYTIIEFAVAIASPLATFTGGRIFKIYGSTAVFAITTICYCICILWSIFRLKESRIPPETLDRKTMCKELASTKNLVDSFKTCFRKRPGNLRLQLWLLLSTYCILSLSGVGLMDVDYPYVKIMYEWGVTKYSDISAGFAVANGFAVIILIRLLTKFSAIGEGGLGLIGVTSQMLENVLKSISFQPWIYFPAKASGMLTSCGNIAVKTRLTKITKRKETGKAFAFLSLCESVIPLIGTALMTSIYNSTLYFFKGFVFAFAAVILIYGIAVFVWLVIQPEPSEVKDHEEDEILPKEN